MKDFIRGSSFKVLIIAVVVLLGLLIYTASAGGSFLANMMGMVSSPMQGVGASAVGSALEFIDLDGLSKDELKQLYTDLSTENAALRDQLVEHNNVKKENEQLKTQLEISEAVPENKMVATSVIGRDPGEVFYGFSIDKGTISGISVGDPVITEQGLVGAVTQAYATTCKVTTILSENLKVAAIVRKKGEDGTIIEESGVITSTLQTASSGLLRMEYLSGDTKLAKGDIVVTSGVGAAFPQNIIIGEVQSVEKSENDISKYAVVKPYGDVKTVRDVFAIVEFPGKEEPAQPTTPPESLPEGAANSEDGEGTGK